MSDRWIRKHPDRFKRWEYDRRSDEWQLLDMISNEAQSLGATRKGVKLQPGECLMSRSYIQGDTGWTDRHIRTVLQHLIDTRQITLERTTRSGSVLKLHPDGIFTVTGQESKPKQADQDEEDDEEPEQYLFLPDTVKQAADQAWSSNGAGVRGIVLRKVFDCKYDWQQAVADMPYDIKQAADGQTMVKYLIQHRFRYEGLLVDGAMKMLESAAYFQ